MDLKDIQREQFYVNVISERDQMIIQLVQENQMLKESARKLVGQKEGADANQHNNGSK